MTAWRPLLLTWDAIFQPQPHGDVAGNPLGSYMPRTIRQSKTIRNDSRFVIAPRRVGSHYVSAALAKMGHCLRNHEFALGTALASGRAQGSGDLGR